MRGTLAATGLALVVMLGYATSCLVWPFARCVICDGRGHHSPSSTRRISRPCRWCRGTGRRLRFGRRLWNRARRVHRDAR